MDSFLQNFVQNVNYAYAEWPIYFQPEDEVSYFETLHLTTRVLFRYETHSPDNSSKIHTTYTVSTHFNNTLVINN